MMVNLNPWFVGTVVKVQFDRTYPSSTRTDHIRATDSRRDELHWIDYNSNLLRREPSP